MLKRTIVSSLGLGAWMIDLTSLVSLWNIWLHKILNIKHKHTPNRWLISLTGHRPRFFKLNYHSRFFRGGRNALARSCVPHIYCLTTQCRIINLPSPKHDYVQLTPECYKKTPPIFCNNKKAALDYVLFRWHIHNSNLLSFSPTVRTHARSFAAGWNHLSDLCICTE